MAEAWACYFGKGKVRALSAGSHPFGSIVKDTYAVMDEKGVSLDGQCSKGLRDVSVADMDVVVGMGFEVECPVPTGFKGRKVNWEIPDPYGRNRNGGQAWAMLPSSKYIFATRLCVETMLSMPSAKMPGS